MRYLLKNYICMNCTAIIGEIASHIYDLDTLITLSMTCTWVRDMCLPRITRARLCISIRRIREIRKTDSPYASKYPFKQFVFWTNKGDTSRIIQTYLSSSVCRKSTLKVSRLRYSMLYNRAKRIYI